MKNKFYSLLALTSFLVLALNSCTNQQTAEVEPRDTEKDSLMNVLSEKDSTISSFLVSYEEIQKNLDSILIRERIISGNIENRREVKGNAKNRINADIAAINELLDQNRKRVEKLSKKLANSNYKNKQLEMLITGLNNQIALKDSELNMLNEKLIALNTNLIQLQTNYDTLTAFSNTQKQIIADKTMAMHTAYYVVGQSKDLQNKKIIDRSGGVLGMGKTATPNPSSFNNGNFTQIDYTMVHKIDINSKKAKIITVHPTDSYKIIESKDKVDSIVITNPDKFWSASKYLIVLTHS